MGYDESSYEQYLLQKTRAREFLTDLKDFLEAQLPARMRVRDKVNEEVKRAEKARRKKLDADQDYQSAPEGAFFKLFGIQCIHQFLVEKKGLTEEDARAALLSESYRNHPKTSSDSPRSKEKHPFTKKAGERVESIVARWWSDNARSPVSQSCPDLALRSPCPHTIVIEGKYFQKGSYQHAQSELVRDIYQCFYYRCLPRIPAAKTHPEWNYDYACLFAYDASEEGNLKTAWYRANDEIEKGLWTGANIYVMVVRSKN
jgi:hypothetical protein